MTLKELCKELSISEATGKNWLRLGKIAPDIKDAKKPSFSQKYVDSLIEDIASGKIQALNSRRNKKFVSGSFFYNSYVPKDSDCLPKIKAISEYLEENRISLTREEVCLVLAYYAQQLFDKNAGNIYISTSNDNSADKPDTNEADNSTKAAINKLIIDLANSYQDNDLSSDPGTSITIMKDNVPDLFAQKLTYEPGTDTLGLLYMSLRDLGSRKNAGSYYTPTEIVRKSVNNLDINGSDPQDYPQAILDPCCGSGNFLIQMPEDLLPESIYGCDIDKTCICIARINLALKYGATYIPTIIKNIRCANFLTANLTDIYDAPSFSPSYIIGNPPWGYDFSDEEKELFNNLYATAKGRSVESYDLFTEKGIRILKRGGRLSFVLPEAALSVKIHKALRKIIISSCNITYLSYLGNVFHKVACPSVILQLSKTGQKLDTHGMKIETTEGSNQKKQGHNIDCSFVIHTHRNVSSDKLSFYTRDEEYSILETMSSLKEHVTLKGRAIFALGIVTGNNDKYISDIPKDGYEVILKGSDISKYHIEKPDRFINFVPEAFQQVAKTDIYRANEKLFYRFINNELTFAYDNEGLVSLNSCNILIPQIPDLNIKYVMAILNSSPAQFYFKKTFNSVKVLRSHLEQIPIPVVPYDEQKKIVDMANKLVKSARTLSETKADISNADIVSLPIYKKLDLTIAKAYGLSDSQYSSIHDKMV